MDAVQTPATDALDEILLAVREFLPEATVMGLPIVGRVLRLAQFLEQRREEQLATFGLTVADFDMLATLRRTQTGTGSVNVREFQRSLMLSSGGITKRLDRLEHAGHIERRPDPHDRRGVLVALTAAGTTLIDEALPAVLGAEAGLVAAVVPDASVRGATEAALRSLLISQEPG
ncbi:MAG: MarR family transcriptional regulator [Ilumatobacteraceae bacterium]|nr:MarR family transcriptional regulator [Ilumatobacter sp.]MCO5328526.1 MarR family transcriptional regulator [Ilumatobacteraceae bacterium]